MNLKKQNKKNKVKYFTKHFFSLRLNNPETGKRFKYFNLSAKVALASLFSGHLAIAVLFMFFLSMLANPARSELRRRLRSGKKINGVEYSLIENTEVLGHRGVRNGAPENTLKAIKTAAEHGAHGVEIDVRFTKDSVPVLMHDPKISRTVKGKKYSREKSIRNMKFEELAKLKTKGEKIPTLEAALKLINKLDLIVNLEVKADKKLKNKEIDMFLQMVDKYCDRTKLSISSFDEKIVKYIKEKRTDIITGYISYGVEFDWLKNAKWANADYVNFHLMGLQLNQMEKIILCKQNNFAIKTWPVNDLKTAHELISAGVDGIISDNPKVLMSRA
ncbi:MAG: glycerophosphodiester phosphodiesterase [Alphaproteobacteria bacterium]|nr:glycerophosphodiester phosphodiesterase [Alphaproteobacteria bacterium]